MYASCNSVRILPKQTQLANHSPGLQTVYAAIHHGDEICGKQQLLDGLQWNMRQIPKDVFDDFTFHVSGE